MRKTFMVFCFVVVAMTLAVQGALAQLTEKKALTLEAARKMVAAAEAAADPSAWRDRCVRRWRLADPHRENG
jgi:hypothetical protein